MANKRIYYAIQQVTMGFSAKLLAHGLQSAAITTNFNLEQVFELGQLEIYQNIENIPEIEVTLNKVLDGYAPMYMLATETNSSLDTLAVATGSDLTGRQNARTDLELSIYPDNRSAATGPAVNMVKCLGMYVGSVSYAFPVDGNFTEDVTLVGNDKVWGGAAVGGFSETAGDSPNGPPSSAGNGVVNRRQHLDMTSCLFPTQIPGINKGTGQNNKQTAPTGVGFEVHFQNISVSCDLGRETIFELGSFAPYCRYVTFPVEVTSEFEVISLKGDEVNASEKGFFNLANGLPAGNLEGCNVVRGNLLNQRIYLKTCEGLTISLGNKNKLTSVNYSGGDTGGGNATVTYSFTTFNDFDVAHTASTKFSVVDVPPVKLGL